jgi:hypothetical protein
MHPSRRFALLAAFALVAVGCRTPAVVPTDVDTSTVVSAASEQGKLKEENRFALEVDELSGLALVSGQGGAGTELVAVGDRPYELVTAAFGAGLDSFQSRTFDMKPLVDVRDGGSEWEAVVRDGGGRTFVLSEGQGLIYVFRGDLQQVVQRIELDYGSLAGPKNPGNSRGEGMVLLANGHILAVMEKNPPRLAEFGPAGAEPMGYVPGAALAAGQVFPLAQARHVEFVVLKEWGWATETAELFTDVSELVVGPDDFLYILSAETGRLGRLEGKLRPDEANAKVKVCWRLPSGIKNAEGLVFFGRHPVVGNDERIGGNNLFILESLP